MVITTLKQFFHTYFPLFQYGLESFNILNVYHFFKTFIVSLFSLETTDFFSLKLSLWRLFPNVLKIISFPITFIYSFIYNTLNKIYIFQLFFSLYDFLKMFIKFFIDIITDVFSVLKNIIYGIFDSEILSSFIGGGLLALSSVTAFTFKIDAGAPVKTAVNIFSFIINSFTNFFNLFLKLMFKLSDHLWKLSNVFLKCLIYVYTKLYKVLIIFLIYLFWFAQTQPDPQNIVIVKEEE
ncbi:hypothetical protein [Candidatus Phytoplasma pruni]|uniref:Uncharacterized protein n=1 Tax=Candidatus Phytoplasma pruni TaxID=479893 RepID=A0A851HBX1_9MOLU|nr:hypothetical protein [Candidatus Phytoplasma pruni]NWN45575.1 hypothetical protein [Candidatus Phytoplasma pruni]